MRAPGSRPSTDTVPDDARAQAFENLDERGLAGAVRAEQADDLSGGGDREVDAAERVDGSVGLAERVNVNGDHGEAMVLRAWVALKCRTSVLRGDVCHNLRLNVDG